MHGRLVLVVILAFGALALAAAWVAFLQLAGLRPGDEPRLIFQLALFISIVLVSQIVFGWVVSLILIWLENGEGRVTELPGHSALLVIENRRGRKVLSVPKDLDISLGQMVTKRRFSTTIIVDGRVHSFVMGSAREFARLGMVIAFVLVVALLAVGIAAVVAPRHGV